MKLIPRRVQPLKFEAVIRSVINKSDDFIQMPREQMLSPRSSMRADLYLAVWTKRTQSTAPKTLFLRFGQIVIALLTSQIFEHRIARRHIAPKMATAGLPVGSRSAHEPI